MQSPRGTLHKSDLFNMQIKAFSTTTTNFKDIPIEYEAFLKKRIQASNTNRKQSLYLIIL